MKNWIARASAALGIASALVLAGCGGGGSSSTPTAPPTTPPPTTPPPNNGGGISGTGSALSASGTIAVSGTGAVSINGVALSTTSVTVRIDDRTGTLADVKDGVTGKVRGRINDDRVTGTADVIEIENELRGPAANVNAAASPQTFTVNGQKVYVDAQTVYANLANFAAIANGAYLEVHGLRDSTGAVRATRIEGKTAVAGDDELRGNVTAVGANTFTVGTAPNAVTVNYSNSTTFSPAGQSAAALTVGVLVEVHGTAAGSTFTASRIDIEDVEDSALAPSGTDDAEVEGFVSGFTAPTSTFKVGTRTVAVTSTTRYEGGSSADLANDARVEVEGSVNSSTGVLTATKVQFKATRVIVQYKPSAVDTTARTLTMLGNQVVVNDLTKLSTLNGAGQGSATLSDIVANSDCVEVRGTRTGATITADEIKELSGGSCKAIVQARVTAKTATTITILGVTVDLSTVPAGALHDASGNSMTLTAFLAAITADASTGTLVKAKGSVANLTLSAEEAELEN